jgi:hypothetical protein
MIISVLRTIAVVGSTVVLLLGPVGGAAFAKDNMANNRVDRAFSAAFGLRYWFSTGKTAKDLHGVGGGALVSRLTYDGLDTHSGEFFGQINAHRIFLNGYVGAGKIVSGNLQDEDFPPVTAPYSSTNSDQREGDVAYATVDLGGYILDRPHARLGGFVGYNFLHQVVNAYGCTQTATNPGICVPTITTSVEVISQDNNWHSLRVGLNGDVNLGDRVMLSGEGAWLPYVHLDGADTHFLRICGTAGCFTGPIPEDGNGWGYQFQGLLEYQATNRLSFGVGGRYWHMETSGTSHFENHVVGGGSPQPVDWSIDDYGVLAQTKLKF